MGVVKCQDCGGVVSDRASACPHCGAPMNAEIPVALKPSKPIDPKAELCLSCHTIVHSLEKKAPAWPGCLLTIAYIVPGIIYFIWRGMSKQKVCPSCGATGLVPASSKRASEILAQAGTPVLAPGAIEETCPSCMLPLTFPKGQNKARCPHCTTVVRRTASGSIVEDDS